MKKGLSIFLAMLISLMPIQVYAHETSQSEIISPMYVLINSITASLTINSGGLATCTASTRVFDTTYRTNVTLTLQQYKDNAWQSIKSWETTSLGTATTQLSNSYNVYSGYKYRVVANVKVFNSYGTLLEMQSSNSSEKSF